MHRVRFKQDSLLNRRYTAMINLKGWQNSDLLRFGRAIHTGVEYLKPIDGINENAKLQNPLTDLELCKEKIGSEIHDGDFKKLGIPQVLFLSKRATSPADHPPGGKGKKIANSDSSQGSCSSDDQGNEIQEETDEQDLPKEPESEPREGIFVPEWVFNDISSSAMAISEMGLSEVMQKTLKKLRNLQSKGPEVLMEDVLVKRLETAHEENFPSNMKIMKIADEIEERFETCRKEKKKEKNKGEANKDEISRHLDDLNKMLMEITAQRLELAEKLTSSMGNIPQSLVEEEVRTTTIQTLEECISGEMVSKGPEINPKIIFEVIKDAHLHHIQLVRDTEYYRGLTDGQSIQINENCSNFEGHEAIIGSQVEQSPVPEIVPPFCNSDMGISLIDVEGEVDDSFFDGLMSGSAKEECDIEDSCVHEPGPQKTLQQNTKLNHTFFDDLTSSSTGKDDNIEDSCVHEIEQPKTIQQNTERELDHT
ncbi:uncharacterized protein Bfra_004507 [Botrytis fragariae]|uniref:Uncharacterized protein n=1 Tax=Botrytis fragariae TaxID=1964551 RepID=A0A8H6AVP8_9HELO|nr:uncharacterized protein Bfra_004507 [Botrytis fragariae]KAF5874497.1 hypothetical protein Bfra_004507 [Botrytis fragariae]